MPKLKVQLRGGFSDRNNIKPENTTIQTTNFDERTRMALATTTSIVFNGAFYGFNAPYDENIQFFIKHVLADVYGVFVDWTKYYSPSEMLKAIYETITEDDYDSILTVVEYIVQMIDATLYTKVVFENQYHTASQLYNQVLEREYVGYRIVDHLVAPITNGAEIEAIEDAVSTPYKDVNQHLEKALGFLSDREAPDYANSIKESITAVERMCSIIVGKASTLSDALKNLSKVGVEIHPALKDGFNKLYAYTNDASGLRHAGQLGGKDATFEEAKFMLVSCSAFVNYLTGVVAKTEK